MSIPPPREQGIVPLKDGRVLGYAEYGVPEGRPVLWFHGTPGARGQITPSTRELAAARGMRLLMVERPGVGDSTPHLYQKVIDWTVDVEQFVDTLEIERFAVVGLSGGGPYTLACAHQMPHRVVAAATLGGVAPSVGDEAARRGIVGLAPLASPLLARTWRPSGRGLGKAIQRLKSLADPAMRLYVRTMPAEDRKLFACRHARGTFHQDLVLGSRDGLYAPLLDLVLFGRDWGFSLREIKVNVWVWQGDADALVPPSHAEHLASLIPQAQLIVRREVGHLGSLGATEEVFNALLDSWPD